MMYNVKDVALLNPDRIIIWLCSFSWDSIDFLRIFQLIASGFQTWTMSQNFTALIKPVSRCRRQSGFILKNMT